MTFTEIFEAIAEATGIEYSHFSVLGRIWDLADYYGVERRGKLVSQVLRELPQLVNRSPESNLIHDLLQMTVRYSKYLCLTGAYSQETTTGKNLFDISKITTKEYSNGTGIVNNGDGTLTVTNSAGNSGVTSEQKLSDVCPSLQIGETYVLSGISSGDNTDKIYLNGAKITWLFEGLKVITQEMLDSYVTFYADSGGNTDTVSNLQIEKGNIATAYEPYTGGAPSPNPDYAQEMQAVEISELYSTGKNFFDASKLSTTSSGGVTLTNNGDGSFTVSGSGNLLNTFSNVYYDMSYEDTKKLLKTGSLKLICETVSYPYFYLQLRNNSGSLVGCSNVDSPTSSISVTEEYLEYDDLFIRIGFYGAQSLPIVPAIVKPMIYQDGDETYEPYHRDTVTLSEPLILRALPNGVCDTYENGVITRRVGVVEFDGSVDEAWSYWEVNNSETCRFFITISKPLIYISENYSICDKLPYILGDVDEEHYRWSSSGVINNQIVIYIKKSRLTEIKVSALRLYLQSNPITVWYQLATPTTEALDIDLEWYGMENFWTDSELDPNMTWKGVSSGVD